MIIQPDTILQRLPALDVHLYSDNTLLIRYAGNELWCGSHGLAILDVFYQPTPFRVAVDRLKERTVGIQDWMLLTHTIVELYEAGVLRAPDQIEVQLTAENMRFDSFQMHTLMLNDQVRTGTYLTAIPQMIQPGDIVLEIGTGTGVLAVAAAKAGATHVYAVEAGSMGKAAQTVFEANGVADRITLIEGWSTEIDLPQKANVLLSEIVSNDGFSERILEFTLDARKRLITPNARQIPSQLRMYGMPVTAAQSWLSERFFTNDVVQQWRDWYDINFDPLARLAPTAVAAGAATADAVKQWQMLGVPQLLADVDLLTLESLVVERNGEFVIGTSGVLNAVVVYFELTLSPSVQLSTYPLVDSTPFSWGNPVFLLTPQMVEAGKRLRFQFSRGRSSGEPSLILGA